MPYRSYAPAPVPPTVGIVFLVVGLALSGMACPARADEEPAKPKAEASVRIKSAPPSIQIDAGTAESPVDAAEPKSLGRHGAHIRVEGDNDDLDFDAFSSQVQKMPWVIGLVFLVVGSIFLTPVVLLIGIIWYKLRKTRLQNEAMLALAAKGVVPPGQAAEALAAGTAPATAAPQVYQQALALRKRVVWSDLRKGIILAAIGLAFVFYALFANGEPSWVGLVLLFVGVGYLVLWWLEGRHLAQAASTSPGAGNGAGNGSSGG
jgi:hypothetical protein